MLRWENFDLNAYLSYIERSSQILYSKVGCGCSFLYTQHSGNWSRKIIKFEVSLGYLAYSKKAWATEPCSLKKDRSFLLKKMLNATNTVEFGGTPF